MPIETTYTEARANLARLLNSVSEDKEIVVIKRRNGESVAMVSAEELNSLLETARLLRSPENARRLLSALARALKGGGKPLPLDKLRLEVGLEPEGS